MIPNWYDYCRIIKPIDEAFAKGELDPVVYIDKLVEVCKFLGWDEIKMQELAAQMLKAKRAHLDPMAIPNVNRCDKAN